MPTKIGFWNFSMTAYHTLSGALPFLTDRKILHEQHLITLRGFAKNFARQKAYLNFSQNVRSLLFFVF